MLYVVFRVAEAEYVISAEQVLQMESYDGATHVPGAPAYVAGIVQVRGRVVPVVDLRVRFGAPPATPTLDTRIVVAQSEDRTVGLLVDTAREVLQLDPAKLQHTPRVMTERAQGFVKGVVPHGKRLLMVLDLERAIGEEHLHGEQLGSGHDEAGRRALPRGGD